MRDRDGFEKWYASEGRIMADAGCSIESVARAAFFVATNAAAEALLSRRMPTRDRLREVADGALGAIGAPRGLYLRISQAIADAIYAELFGVTD